MLGRCDKCGGWLMANGVGYCANSRYRPFICAGNAASTCALCGRLKGGAKGCWARGCLRNGGEPEALTASQLRNRISNIRPRQRERAQREEERREAMLSQERRAQAAAAEARGLKTCLRTETGRREGAPTKRVSWAAPYPPSGRPLGALVVPASVREPLFWEKPGSQADCDNCGCSCDPWADGAFPLVPGGSRFVRTEVFCQVCAKDLGVGALSAT